jgi:glycosyltransferase involved in cell wall biosynthesis
MNNTVHFVHYTSNPGGLEVLLPSIITNLKKGKFNAFIIRPPHENENNVYDKIPINLTYGASGYYAFWLLLRYAHKRKNDIFHVFNIGPYALLMMRLAGVRKLVYAIHGTLYWKNRKQRLLRKFVWQMAMSSKYRITSNSEYSKNVFIKQVIKNARPILLYNPIDTERFAKNDSVTKNDKKKIVYSGRLTKGKNLFKWIHVAEAINKKHPDICFEIYGDGPLRQSLQKLINERNLKEIVALKGFYKNAEEIYKNADLLLFLSEYESFGNVVVESILCETPVIAGSIPSMKEIFQNFSEFLISLDDNLEQNVLLKIEQIEFLSKLAKEAAEEFKERFSLEQHIRKVEKIYESFNS